MKDYICQVLSKKRKFGPRCIAEPAPSLHFYVFVSCDEVMLSNIVYINALKS